MLKFCISLNVMYQNDFTCPFSNRKATMSFNFDLIYGSGFKMNLMNCSVFQLEMVFECTCMHNVCYGLMPSDLVA